MIYQLDFVEPPAPGLTLRFDGVEFRLLSAEPHVRRDGGASALLTWSSCCTTCGEPFEVVTGLRSKTVTKRCPAHRVRGVPATPAAADRMLRNHRRFSAMGKF